MDNNDIKNKIDFCLNSIRLILQQNNFTYLDSLNISELRNAGNSMQNILDILKALENKECQRDFNNVHDETT